MGRGWWGEAGGVVFACGQVGGWLVGCPVGVYQVGRQPGTVSGRGFLDMCCCGALHPPRPAARRPPPHHALAHSVLPALQLLAAAAAAAPPLRALNLQHTGVTDAGLAQLGASFPRLNSLQLSYCRSITDAGLRELAALMQLQSLCVYNAPKVRPWRRPARARGGGGGECLLGQGRGGPAGASYITQGCADSQSICVALACHWCRCQSRGSATWPPPAPACSTCTLVTTRAPRAPAPGRGWRSWRRSDARRAAAGWVLRGVAAAPGRGGCGWRRSDATLVKGVDQVRLRRLTSAGRGRRLQVQLLKRHPGAESQFESSTVRAVLQLQGGSAAWGCPGLRA